MAAIARLKLTVQRVVTLFFLESGNIYNVVCNLVMRNGLKVLHYPPRPL